VIYVLAIVLALGGGSGVLSGLLTRGLLRGRALRPVLIGLDLAIGLAAFFVGVGLDFRLFPPKDVVEEVVNGRVVYTYTIQYTSDPPGLGRLLDVARHLVVPVAVSVLFVVAAELIIHAIWIRRRGPSVPAEGLG
jgi:heme/copper-type cytochrome/quinol oxidase subunit 2